MIEAIRLLIFQESSGRAEPIIAILEKSGLLILPKIVSMHGDLEQQLESGQWDFILFLDPSKEIQPVDACKIMHDRAESTSYVIMSDALSDEQINELIEMGATDCLKFEQGARLVATLVRDTGKLLRKGSIDERLFLLAEKMASLDFLVPGIFHDLRNNNAIITLTVPTLEIYITKLLEEIEVMQKDPEYKILNMSLVDFRTECDDILENMEFGANHVTALVSRLKNHMQTEYNVEKKPIRISQVLEDVIALLGKHISKTIHCFDVEIPNDLPESLINPSMIEQAITMLLVNAIQALDKERSTIGLRTAQKGENNVQIIVEDNGTGIEQNIRDKIFEPGFSTKSTQSNTGLGLTMARIIVEDHKRELTFESQQGLGSRFCITLPIIQE